MTKKKSVIADQKREMADLIGKCVESLCCRQISEMLDKSDFGGGGSAELLRLIQLLEKYADLQHTVMQEEQEERAEIDYTLVRNYLNKKFDDRA